MVGNIPTHDTGFIQPGRTSEVGQPGLRHLYNYPVYIPIYATEDDQASDFIQRGCALATCTNELPPDDAEPPG